MKNSKDYAIFYAQEKGWAVFPLIPHDKKPLFKSAHEKGNPCKGECGQVGHGFNDATKDTEIINEWWSKNPAAGIGIATGDISRFFALDVDPVHNGEDTIKKHTATYGELPKTITALTGSGGHHYLFKMTNNVRNSAGKLGVGIDTRGNGGYIATAPTIHPCGNPYKWIEPPSKTLLAESPEWILNMLFSQNQTQTVTTSSDGAYISGQRNNALTSLAGTMRRKNMTEDAIFLALNAENLNRCMPPLPEQEVRMIAMSVMRYQAQDAMPLTNRDRVQAEWAFIKCVYEFPESLPAYQDVKPSDFGQSQLSDFWKAVNLGIDVTTSAANVGILAEIEKYSDFDTLRQEGYAKQIKHYGYHSQIAKYADSIKVHALAGNTQGVNKFITELNKIPAQDEARLISISEVADSVEDEIKERAKNPCKVWGIPYAWEYISELTGGKHKGELTLVVAEPKIGKSWWCLQDALSMAVDYNVPTFYWCGEMRRNQLMRRFYQLLGVNGRNMKSGNMSEQDNDLMRDAKALILNSPLYIDDKSLSLYELRPLLKQYIDKFGLQHVTLDYARLIQAPGKDENEQSKAVSLECKRICQDLNIAITLIVSVNKAGMDSQTETATKSNVSGSGQQIHDADNIFFITKFNGGKWGIKYGVNPSDYDNTVSFHLTASRELDHIVAGGFIPYQRNNNPKFIEIRKK